MVAGVDVGEQEVKEEEYMKSLIHGTAVRVILAVFFAAFACALSPCGQAQSGPKTSGPVAPRTFNTPQQAAEALINAAESYDVPTLPAAFLVRYAPWPNPNPPTRSRQGC